MQRSSRGQAGYYERVGTPEYVNRRARIVPTAFNTRNQTTAFIATMSTAVIAVMLASGRRLCQNSFSITHALRRSPGKSSTKPVPHSSSTYNQAVRKQLVKQLVPVAPEDQRLKRPPEGVIAEAEKFLRP